MFARRHDVVDDGVHAPVAAMTLTVTIMRLDALSEPRMSHGRRATTATKVKGAHASVAGA